MTSFKKSFMLITAISFILYHECVGDPACIRKLNDEGFRSENSSIVNYLKQLNTFFETDDVHSQYYSYLENTIFSMIITIDNALRNIYSWCKYKQYNEYNCFSIMFEKQFRNVSGINNLKDLVNGNIKMNSFNKISPKDALYFNDEDTTNTFSEYAKHFKIEDAKNRPSEYAEYFKDEATTSTTSEYSEYVHDEATTSRSSEFAKYLYGGAKNYVSGLNNLKDLVIEKIKITSLTDIFPKNAEHFNVKTAKNILSEYVKYLYQEANKFDEHIYNVEKWCQKKNFMVHYKEMIIKNDSDNNALFNKILTVDSWCAENPYDYCYGILTYNGFKSKHIAQFNYGVLVIKYDKTCSENNYKAIYQFCTHISDAFYANKVHGIGDQFIASYSINENENE